MTPTGCAPTTAEAVANFFLDLEAEETESVPPIDQMKIQKLLFYAHAWHLAMNKAPLFEEDIEAWPWGPVIGSIYTQTRGRGRKPVAGIEFQRIEPIGDGPISFRTVTPPEPNDETKEFLRGVWRSHKSRSGINLSNSTHFPGEPWTIVRDQKGSLDDKPVIPNPLIQKVFEKKLET